MKKKYDIKIDNFEDRYGFYEWNKPSYYLTKFDERYKNYQEYKKNTGIYPDELWSLDISICNFIIPRLKEFKDTIKECKSYPANLKSYKEWIKILDKMIFSFEEHKKDKFIDDEIAREKYQNKIQEGFKLFIEYFGALWF